MNSKYTEMINALRVENYGYERIVGEGCGERKSREVMSRRKLRLLRNGRMYNGIMEEAERIGSKNSAFLQMLGKIDSAVLVSG